MGRIRQALRETAQLVRNGIRRDLLTPWAREAQRSEAHRVAVDRLRSQQEPDLPPTPESQERGAEPLDALIPESAEAEPEVIRDRDGKPTAADREAGPADGEWREAQQPEPPAEWYEPQQSELAAERAAASSARLDELERRWAEIGRDVFGRPLGAGAEREAEAGQ